MADDENADENDVEAEMMRMMQEELGGDGGDAGESDDDAALAEMAAALGGDDDGGNIDDMLEQEMLKAMQSDSGGSGGSGSSGGAVQAFTGGSAAAPAQTPDGIERLADVDVNVTVELGGASIEIKDIMQWTRDSIVGLDPEENDPVDILVNGKLFAKGEVVVVADTFGVRILELVDPPVEPSFRNQ